MGEFLFFENLSVFEKFTVSFVIFGWGEFSFIEFNYEIWEFF